jgi:two-component system chemotaxis sensor kinase CheA
VSDAEILALFRDEAEDLLDALGRGLIALGRGQDGAFDEMLRAAHTLKGAGRMVGQVELATSAHALEDLLLAERDKPRADRRLSEIEFGVRRLRELLPGDTSPSGTVGDGEEPAGDGAATRLDAEAVSRLFDEIDEVLSAVHRTRDALAGVEALVQRQEAADRMARGRGADPFQAERLAATVREQAAALRTFGLTVEEALRDLGRRATLLGREARNARLVPLEPLRAALERNAHEAARTLGRRVRFELHAPGVRVGPSVATLLADALVHLVQNAVAHGIEAPRERAARGKPPEGRVVVRARTEGPTVVVEVEDDGRGIDPERLREAAVTAGAVGRPEAGGLSREASLDLAFHAGVSTAGSAGAFAGRGIGLGAVAGIAGRLGGSVRLVETSDAGTRFELTLPGALASAGWVRVRTAAGVVGLPDGAVQAAAQVPDTSADTVPWQGEDIVLVDLGTLLGAPSSRPPRLALVMDGAAARVAVGVEEILGRAEGVVREPPQPVPGVIGVAVGASGVPEPILDPTVITGAPAWRPPATRAAVRVLVVDDSITSRILETSILENAGYEVAAAASGEEAIALATTRPFDVAVVDVEMPGIDGYEVIRRLKADPRTASLPCVLLTSRDAEEDRRRGAEAGAAAHLLKGRFRQDVLLETLGALVERR